MDSRREQIVRAAAAIAAEEGAGAMTVRAVATRAGIGPSTLRHYFPSQQALFHEVVGRSFHANLDDLDINDATIPAAERLTACMRQFLPADNSQTRLLEGWIGLYASALGPARTEQGARLLESLTRHARDRVEKWLETLEREGTLQPGERQRHVTTMLAMIDGLCIGLLVPGSGTTVAGAHAVLADVITHLVIASAG